MRSKASWWVIVVGNDALVVKREVCELTDEAIRTDPILMGVIERNRRLLDETGWTDAPLVDQYNLATTFELATDDD
jgi:hypothetical protein